MGMELVGEAKNGKEALSLCATHHPDILISDIRMPGMSGIDLARELISENPEIKIIFLSGYSDFSYAQQAIELNICGYLLKPYSEQDISDILRRTANLIVEEQNKKQQEQQLQELYRQNLAAMRETFLYKILTRSPDTPEKDFWSQANTLGLDFQFDLFALLSINLPNHCSMELEESLSSTAIYQMIKACVSRYCKTSYTLAEHKELFLVLLNIDENLPKADALSLISTISNTIIDEFHRKYDQDVPLIRKSSFGYGFQSWNRLYSEVYGEENGIDRKIDPINLIFREYKVIEPELMDTVRQQQLSLFVQFVESLLLKARKMNLTAAYITRSCISFCQEAYKLLDETSPGSMHFHHDISEWMGRILNLKTIDDVQMWFSGFFTMSEKYLQVRKKKKNQLLAKRVLEVIHERYHTGIDVASISREVFISQNYLRQIFKEYTGKSLSSYLTDFRIEKVCELLKTTSLHITDIPDKVGLANNPHFFYLFKKATNLTPSEYRLESSRYKSGIELPQKENYP